MDKIDSVLNRIQNRFGITREQAVTRLRFFAERQGLDITSAVKLLYRCFKTQAVMQQLCYPQTPGKTLDELFGSLDT
jgi:hypothetical protein